MIWAMIVISFLISDKSQQLFTADQRVDSAKQLLSPDLPDWVDSHYFYRIHSSKNSICNSSIHSHCQDNNTTTKRIAISTINIGSKSYYQLTRALQSEYARQHNYDFYALKQPFETEIKVTHYQKILSSLKLLDTPRHHPSSITEDRYYYDYIFWIDADTIITNMTVRLEDIIGMASSSPTSSDNSDNRHHVIISGDLYLINSAQVLWRNTDRTREILQGILDMYDEENVGANIVTNYEQGMVRKINAQVANEF